MVPSPRKRVPRATFNQTWDDSDAALFDPSSLPIARVPRAWERKQETKKTEEGREKTIWRRFNLRSRAANATDESDAEDHDALARPVKKRQHLSPEAMEKTSAKLNGRKRTFQATRWDRRKSVLPRKKTTRSQDPTTDDQEAADDSEGTQDATGADLDEEGFTDVQHVIQPEVELAHTLAPESKDRRGTFTFTMEAEAEAEAVDELADYERLNGLQDTTLAEDTTSAQLFRSPAKLATTRPFEMPEEVDYPKLPHNDMEDAVAESIIEPIEVDEVAKSTESAEIDFEGEEQPDTEDGPEKTEDQEILPQELDVQHMEIVHNAQSAETLSSTLSHIERSNVECVEASSEVIYPALPADSSHNNPTELRVLAEQDDGTTVANEDTEMSEDTDADQDEQASAEVLDDIELQDDEEESADEEFTEASLQLNILRDYQDTLRGKQLLQDEASEQDGDERVTSPNNACQTAHLEAAAIPECVVDSDQLPQLEKIPIQPLVKTSVGDITDGLTLSFTPARESSAEPTPRKLQSPPSLPAQSGPDDATMSIALDDDTALLKDFLNRAAASKAEKAAVMTHRRESLQNRRDSDVIRHALASPRKILEEKDPNSPSKHGNELTLDLSRTPTLNMNTNALASPMPEQADDDGTAEENSLRGSRRSSRTKKSRLPAPASAAPAPAQASKIAIRRADGTEHVVLKKSDAQELATLTRANTRKNKQGAFGVTVRLMKLAVDSASLPPLDESTKEIVIGKNIRWDEQLAYYQENPETVAEAESLATPDELGMPDSVSTPSAKPKSKISKSSTPKIRRVRGLGTANGTPGKGLLAPAALLPEDVQNEMEVIEAPAQQLPKPKASKFKKMPVASSTTAPVSTPPASKLPSLDIVPVGVDPTKERKSRLAAPKKVMLPQPVATLAVEGKENTQRAGISGATPRKGIPAPKVLVPPSVGMESGLPRRRGRKI